MGVPLVVSMMQPDNEFFPNPGELSRLDVPGGPGVRVETGYVAGATVPPYYDSLVAKVVVHGRDREVAVARSIQALEELRIEGVRTTKDVHLRLLRESVFREGPVTTAWLEGFLAGE